ncbi:MAG: DUF1669 domain-containing protein [Verrucomicrobia bacterium]|nr:DUF1669 domain-containing protein [Verrucomicrobiota bacterium]
MTKKKLPRSPLVCLLLAVYALIVYSSNTPSPTALPTAHLPLQLYSNQVEGNLQKTFKEAILNAKESITCIIYALTDDEIITALRKKAEEGLDVTIVHDPVATQNISFRLGPKVHTSSLRNKGLMHHKLIAIDHKQVWLGSANLTRDSLLLHANLVVGLDSPEWAAAIEQKAQDPQKRRYKQPLLIQTNEQKLELWFLPDAPQALDRLLQLLDSAKKTIKVAMFTFTHPKLIQALVDAHKRGVNVEIVLDSDSSRQTSQLAYQRFKREKMKVLVSDRMGLLHEKIAIIDDSQLVAGSTNWTKAAFTNNHEALCILSDLSKEQQSFLHRFWTTTLQESKP